ncbi:spermatogenesis-associated protein 6 isoform X1 [Acipenser ruthenus]|uniref:spermatogenesis-associated protein 6 isoform X1 n=1 Tax=Acipenser ruthenus TaxID=7906 RepID=UPI0027418427|nr:spermatogenesis-associated protein 6 isoform X1 [Acipenser ruthenus]
MPQKAVKVVVELQLHAVTCPGVFLTNKDDVYLSVCIMGQYRKSACHLPVFPLLFHEKMIFEKVFKMVMDPADVAEQLEYETAKCELIQLFPPVGETLASYEEDARSFLFPEPKLAPTYPGVDREVLMSRTRNFPGIAPKLEFSTRTTIKECSFKREKGVCASNHLVAPRKPNIRKAHRSGSSTPSRNRSASPGKKRVSCCIEKNSKKQTNVSRSRSLSLCANKRVAEDFELNRLGLAQLNLGPHKFNSDKDARSHFQVPNVDSSRPISKHDSPPRLSPDLLISRSRSTSTKSRLSGGSAALGNAGSAALSGAGSAALGGAGFTGSWEAIEGADPGEVASPPLVVEVGAAGSPPMAAEVGAASLPMATEAGAASSLRMAAEVGAASNLPLVAEARAAGSLPLAAEARAAGSLPLAAKVGATGSLPLTVEARAAGSLLLSLGTGAALLRSLGTDTALLQSLATGAALLRPLGTGATLLFSLGTDAGPPTLPFSSPSWWTEQLAT